MTGHKLTSLFAYKPNKLKYCGENSATKKLYKCITENKCKDVEKEIEKFKALYSYLKVISDKFDKQLLDYKVSEAYWIGNSLLKHFRRGNFDSLLTELAKQDTPEIFLKQIGKKFKNSKLLFIPHHSFHVLFLGVGNVTGSVENNIENINNCLIRWGKITNISPQKAKANAFRLSLSADRLSLTKKDESFHFDPQIVPSLKIGDIICTHWGEVCMKLDRKQKNELEKYTKMVIEALNKQKA